MNIKYFLIVLILLAVTSFTLFSGCTGFAGNTPETSGKNCNAESIENSVPAISNNASDVLYQVSTIDALLLGVYDGVLPVSDLKTHGDFGIGTFDGLEGEMLALDGNYYQIKTDG
ncbi:MAG: alpha-acetolactate decarboxylase, partial [Methanosarcina mazei]|nr:alpha-acetolactate decarboxylase [Methanosarcina mazei]